MKFVLRSKTNKDKSTHIFPPHILKPNDTVYSMSTCNAENQKKFCKSLKFLRMTTGLCPFRSYYSMHALLENFSWTLLQKFLRTLLESGISGKFIILISYLTWGNFFFYVTAVLRLSLAWLTAAAVCGGQTLLRLCLAWLTAAAVSGGQTLLRFHLAWLRVLTYYWACASLAAILLWI